MYRSPSQCLSKRFLNWSRDSDSITAWGSEFQSFTVLWLNDPFLTFSLLLRLKSFFLWPLIYTRPRRYFGEEVFLWFFFCVSILRVYVPSHEIDFLRLTHAWKFESRLRAPSINCYMQRLVSAAWGVGGELVCTLGGWVQRCLEKLQQCQLI